jgi:hypothetical protein
VPRWVRFLSCSFTGLLISLLGFFLAVSWYEGGHNYWRSLVDFAGTSGFWYLTALFGLLVAAGLLIARLAVHFVGLADAVAGMAAGAVPAAMYAVFLVAAHAGDWGGWAVSLQKSWAAAGVFIAPFALGGGFTAWLWHRLD